MKNSKQILALIIGGLVLMAASTRLLPHPPNFTPIIAIALFAGAYFRFTKWSWILPLAVMIVSDLGLWWMHGYELFTVMRLVIYITLVAIVAIGIPVGKKISVGNVLGGTLAGAVCFFIVTNFAVWVTGTLYPMSWQGLIACYTAAIPFFRNTLTSTLIYSAAMFGAVEWAKSYWSLSARPVATT